MAKGVSTERTHFHPRVCEWLKRQGFTDIRHEPRIGQMRPDFIVSYKNWRAIVECKEGVWKNDLGDAITQVNRYRNYVHTLLRYRSYQHWTVSHFESADILCCLAIETLVNISLADAFAMCADEGVLLLNPGFRQHRLSHLIEAPYPYVATQQNIPLDFGNLVSVEVEPAPAAEPTDRKLRNTRNTRKGNG